MWHSSLPLRASLYVVATRWRGNRPSGSGEPCGFVDSLRSPPYQLPFTATDLHMIGCPTLWHARRLLACTSGHLGHANRPHLTASDPVRVGDRMILGGKGIKQIGKTASEELST